MLQLFVYWRRKPNHSNNFSLLKRLLPWKLLCTYDTVLLSAIKFPLKLSWHPHRLSSMKVLGLVTLDVQYSRHLIHYLCITAMTWREIKRGDNGVFQADKPLPRNLQQCCQPGVCIPSVDHWAVYQVYQEDISMDR